MSNHTYLVRTKSQFTQSSNHPLTISFFPATVETLYHAVAMLSCRSQSLQESSPSSASFVRQSLSAAKVTSIVGDEYHNQLSLLPMVPYAVSLSLRVCYRDLRLSKAPMLRTRSRKQLLRNCTILRELGEIFWSAVVMVELAEKTICEMDKVYSTISSAQQHQTANEATETTRTDKAVSNVENSDTTDQNNPWKQRSNGRDVNEPNAGPETDFNGTQNVLAQNYDFSTFGAEIFDNLPYLDVFEHFDPNFGLEAIDATLGDNINPSFPVSLVDF